MHHAHNQSVVVVGGKVNMGSIESLVGVPQKGKLGGHVGGHQKHPSMNTRGGQSSSVDKKSLYRMLNKK